MKCYNSIEERKLDKAIAAIESYLYHEGKEKSFDQEEFSKLLAEFENARQAYQEKEMEELL